MISFVKDRSEGDWLPVASQILAFIGKTLDELEELKLTKIAQVKFIVEELHKKYEGNELTKTCFNIQLITGQPLCDKKVAGSLAASIMVRENETNWKNFRELRVCLFSFSTQTSNQSCVRRCLHLSLAWSNPPVLVLLSARRARHVLRRRSRRRRRRRAGEGRGRLQTSS